MEIYDFAIHDEILGEAMYRNLASRAPNNAIKGILTQLAKDEMEHRRTLQKMKDSLPDRLKNKKADELRHEHSKVHRFRESHHHIDVNADDELKIYQQALDMERESREFYEKESKLTTDPDVRKILEQISKEEKKHEDALQGVIDYISAPSRWKEHYETSMEKEDYDNLAF